MFITQWRRCVMIQWDPSYVIRDCQILVLLFKESMIKTLLASKRNQIYSEASSTRFSAINLSYFTLPMKLLTNLHQITDISGQPDFSRNTIQIHFSIYISEHFTPLNAIKYILNLLQQTFPITIKHTLTLSKSKSTWISNKSRTF